MVGVYQELTVGIREPEVGAVQVFREFDLPGVEPSVVFVPEPGLRAPVALHAEVIHTAGATTVLPTLANFPTMHFDGSKRVSRRYGDEEVEGGH